MLIPLDEETSWKIEKAIRGVEKALVDKDFKRVISLTKESRLTAQDIETTLNKYGGKVTIAPDYVFDSLEIIPISGPNSKSWHVDFDLWIDGKQSDLTLSLTTNLTDKGAILSIDNFHIL
jgi:hypothetical protein